MQNIDRIATRTLGEALQRLQDLSRDGVTRCDLYAAEGAALTHEEAADIVIECEDALEYAKDHLQYLREKEEPAPERFKRGDPVKVKTGTSDDVYAYESAVVIQMQHFDGRDGVLVRMDDSDEVATFELGDVFEVAV